MGRLACSEAVILNICLGIDFVRYVFDTEVKYQHFIRPFPTGSNQQVETCQRNIPGTNTTTCCNSRGSHAGEPQESFIANR